MNQFRFRFGTVLRVRELHEKTKQKECASQQTQLLDEQNKLTNIQKKKERNTEEIHKSLTGQLHVEVLKMSNRYGLKLEDDEKKQAEIVSQEEVELAKKRAELIKASQERRIIERIQERDLRNYQKMLDSEETKFLDDVAAVGYTRKNLPPDMQE